MTPPESPLGNLSERADDAVRLPPTQTERDAERYRWLREQVRSKPTMLAAQALFWNHESRRQFDEAVDRARASDA